MKVKFRAVILFAVSIASIIVIVFFNKIPREFEYNDYNRVEYIEVELGDIEKVTISLHILSDNYFGEITWADTPQKHIIYSGRTIKKFIGSYTAFIDKVILPPTADFQSELNGLSSPLIKGILSSFVSSKEKNVFSFFIGDHNLGNEYECFYYLGLNSMRCMSKY
ncbi:hypothetical protein [Shewanella colwelliana]|uniref:hypothetical protein n=1 Tax=Shewanella colwelliana TaxID=23 RepID=UPI003735C58E